MRKAKYKPWQVLLHQKWILINTVTKWDTSPGVFQHVIKRQEEILHMCSCLNYQRHVGRRF